LSFRKLHNIAIRTGAEICWRMPAPFRLVQMLGNSCSLRCVVFHHIAAAPTPFTSGIRVTVSPGTFENALRFLTKHYVPVTLDDVLSNGDGRGLPPRPVLLTFDDAYASVAEIGAPLCRQYGVPAVFFVNAAYINNRRLAPDNLVCYVANVVGMHAVNSAIRAVPGREGAADHSLAEVFGVFFPTLSLDERDIFLDALCSLAGMNENRLAEEENLYLTGDQLRDLENYGVEVGNHTYSHTHCRSLAHQEIVAEIERNKAALEELSGRRVRSFSQPYGSSKDLTRTVADCLRRSGHQAVFLSESVANQKNPDLYHLDRVSTCAHNDQSLFFELEVLPRLRVRRNQLYRDTRPLRPVQPRSNAGIPELSLRRAPNKRINLLGRTREHD
jgi:peptidoglycan/xylan/chitin deacetylase (PgdA/CDA1 family)